MKSKNLHVDNRATLSPGLIDSPGGPFARPPRTAWLRAWGPVLAICAVIFTASSLPARALPKALLFPGQDKAEHALVYGLLGFFVARAWQRRARSFASPLAPALAAAGFTVAFGLSDEFHQWFVPGRAVEGLDLLADATGGTLGGLLAVLLSRARSSRS